MPTAKQCATAGCGGDPSVSGAALGLCPRCYQRKRRGLPGTAAPVFRPDGESDHKLTIRVSTALKRDLDRHARRCKTSLNGLVVHWLEVQVRRQSQTPVAPR